MATNKIKSSTKVLYQNMSKDEFKIIYLESNYNSKMFIQQIFVSHFFL